MLINREYDHKDYGHVCYDKRGKPICHICGKAFDKPMSHVRQVHELSAKEYKIMFGLNIGKGILSEESRIKCQQSVKKHYDVVVTNNLIKHGKKTRFTKGHPGRTRNQISEQELIRIRKMAKLRVMD